MMNAPYQILPQIAQDDLDRLSTSIRERGVEVPVIVDENGTIIDGHHRAMIADSLGIEYPKEVRMGLSEAQKRLLAVDLNMARRQLTDGQKLLLAEQIAPDIRAEAKKRQGTRTDLTSASSDAEVSDQPGRSTKEIADRVGYSSSASLERHAALLNKLRAEPDGEILIGYVESGDWDITDVRKELKSREAKRHEPDPVAKVPTPIRDPLEEPVAPQKKPRRSQLSGKKHASLFMEIAGFEAEPAYDIAEWLIDLGFDLTTFPAARKALADLLMDVELVLPRVVADRRKAAA